MAKIFGRSLALAVCCAGSAWAIDSSWLDTDRWPLIPIPEVITDPNSGTTVGLLPVFLFEDERREVHGILAPDLNRNPHLGVGGTFRYFAYPSEDTQWYVVAGGAEHVARLVDLDFASGLTHDRWWSLEGRFFFERDPTQRLFGLGNDSGSEQETNYSKERLYGEVLGELNLAPSITLGVHERLRRVRIARGVFPSLRFTGDAFPDLAGLEGGTDLRNRIFAAYDTRDSLAIPTRGGLLVLFGGVADSAVLGSASYSEWGVQFARYVPLGPRITLAGNLSLHYVSAGRHLPFWAMSRLGGENSEESNAIGISLDNQQTLRGFGAARFVDRSAFLTNFEARTRVFEADAFGTHGVLELAPFVDVGRVFHDLGENPVRPSELHPAGGIGFRVVARPFVVGYLDVGYGAEGAAVFSGINYPF